MKNRRPLPADLLSAEVKEQLQTLQGCDVDTVIQMLAEEDQQPIRQKMMELIQKVASERMDAEYLPDWLAIYRFLQKPDQVEVYLEKFEAALQQYAAQSDVKDVLNRRSDGVLLLPKNRSLPYKTYKLLSGCMYQWAAENGFSQSAKIITALDKEPFFNLLTSRSIFKDAAANVGNEHGVWSHALQWYFIFEHHKQTKFLQHSPMDVYEHFNALPPKEFAKNDITVWMIVLDQLSGNNFTSPEFVTANIKHMMKRMRWPLLYDCINRGWEKMNWKFGSINKHVEYQADKHRHEQVDGVVYRKFKG